MKTPMKILQDYIIVPAHKFYKDFLSKNARHSYCKNVANFIFNCSKETALIMLFFNAVSILSSHISQIGGLKKSKRENKEYLITQEKKELGLDLVLTIIPPFMLNNFLKKKLEAGLITTKEAREKLINLAAPVVGASRDELYSIEHIRPLKETVSTIITRGTSAILKHTKKMPKSIENVVRNIDTGLKKKLPNFAEQIPKPNLEDIATDLDNLAKEKKVSKTILKQFRNGSAYDELCGQINGLLIITTLAYTILASNVIMPILKNKLANREYEKQLAKMGETKESIKRKKRFEYNNVPILKPDNDIFNIFSDTNLTISQTTNPQIITKSPNNPFKEIEKYKSISSQPIGLRI